MPLLAILLVLADAVSHSYWNLLAKQARDRLIFFWLLYLTGGLITLPLAVYGGLHAPIHPLMWLCAAATSLAFTAYSILLARAYRLGDVSLVYPVMRAAGPLLALVIAYLFLHERLTLPGVLGVLLILAGATGISWPGRRSVVEGEAGAARRRQVASALLAIGAGATVAVFSTIDKTAINQVHPLAHPLFYIATLFWGTTLCMAPLVLRRRSWEAVVREARADWRPLWITGALNVFGYTMVLYALRLAPVGYVVALRSLAVVFAVILGSRVLGEGRGAQRLLLAGVIVAGIALLAMQR